MPEQEEKAEDKGQKTKPKKPLEYRRFEEILRKVIKAPPLKRPTTHNKASHRSRAL